MSLPRADPAPVPRGRAPVERSSWLARWAALILFVSLALGLVVPKVAGAGFLLLALLGMIWLEPGVFRNRWALSGHERLLVFSVFLFVLVWLLAWLVHGLDATGLDDVGRILRLLLIIPLYLFLSRVQGLEKSWWSGLAAGAAIAGIYAIVFVVNEHAGQWAGRVGGSTNPIYFGGVVLAFALMLLPSITSRQMNPAARLALVAAILLGITASALSGSRGAWLALPLLLCLYLVTLGTRQNLLKRIGIPAAILVFAVALAALPGVPLGERLVEALHSFDRPPSEFAAADTLAIRWQMWLLSVETLRDQWLFGGGPGAFREALEAAVASGRLSPAFLEYEHPHNQFLSVLMIAGVPGLISFLMLLAFPARRFAMLWKTSLERPRMFGWGGLVALTVFAVMCMSESIFQRNSGIIWFALLLATTTALVQQQRWRELFTLAPKRLHTLSVIMICRDEADRISHALRSVAGWADEIIVLDSGSTDDTVEICRKFTDRVEVTDWPGFGVQKQRALERARGDWVLSLDADEVVSDELRREIDWVLARPSPYFDGYRVPWSTRAFGATLRFGRWTRAPLRLVRRDRAGFTPASVHEKLLLTGSFRRSGRLEGPLYHYVFRSLDHARAKLAGYARLQAAERAAHGKRATHIGARVRAAINFIDNYLLHGAFLDGRAGWMMSRLYARYTYDKYRRLASTGQ